MSDLNLEQKKVLAFDLDDTLNVAKMPITPEMAEILVKCLRRWKIAPISGQTFGGFIRQIADPLRAAGATDEDLINLHMFVAQGTQYYRFKDGEWEQVYNYPLTDEQVEKITQTIKQAASKLGYWEEEQLLPGDEIIENRVSQVTFSALGQKASVEKKYAWDPDHKKREAISARAREIAPEFMYEIGGTTSINVTLPGRNKSFGMTHMLKELGVEKSEVLYFGDMTQPGGNDYPVVEMGFDVVTVKNWQETAGILTTILQ